jgi:hypothetical protein
VTVRNAGTATLSIGGISVGGTDANQFSKAADNCSKRNLATGASCTLAARFSPTSSGSKTAILSIPSTDPDENPFNVALSGTGVTAGNPEITVTPTALDFGNVALGVTSQNQIVTVKNDGTANLTLGAISVGGTNANQFSKAADNCSKKTLTPGATCTVAARFRPTSDGLKTAGLNIPSNDPDENPFTVSLSGTGGSGGGGTPDVAVTPTALDFGSVAVGTRSAVQTVTVRNEGTASLTLGAVTFGGANADQFLKPDDKCSKKTLAAGASCIVSVRFRPTSSGAKAADLVIPSNDPDENAVNVALTGTGAP